MLGNREDAQKIRGYKCMKWTEGMVVGGEVGAEVEHGVKGLVTQKNHSHQQLDRKSSCKRASEQEVVKAAFLTFQSATKGSVEDKNIKTEEEKNLCLMGNISVFIPFHLKENFVRCVLIWSEAFCQIA